MPRYVCWVDQDIAASANELDELKRQLENYRYTQYLGAIECYDYKEHEYLDVCELLGINPEKSIEEFREEIKRIIRGLRP